MRIPALAILTMMTLWTAAPARAQTYDPAYPVCLHAFGKETEYYDCTFASMAQCSASASGRNAMCVINPYYAGRGPAEGNVRRHRRAS